MSLTLELIPFRKIGTNRLEKSVRLEKFQELDANILPEIWSAHFTEKSGNLGSSIAANVANLIKSRLTSHPMFILPISRLTGHEILLTESVVSNNFVVQVTGLEEYKNMGPQAPTWASFTFYTELSDEKGLALIHGRFDGTQMNSMQTGSLLQKFCAAYSNDELFRWVEDFTNQPDKFDFKKFMNTFSAHEFSKD